MYSSFDCWPKRVVSGEGSLYAVGDIVAQMDKKKIIVFTGPNLAKTDTIKDFVKQLEEKELAVSTYSDFGQNPTVEMVDKAAQFMHTVKPEAIVAVGGGSPVDAAKAANVVYTHGGTVNDYDVVAGGIEKIQNTLLPLIVVPTTAGSGTEETLVSVITDEVRKTKFGVLSPYMIPDVSVLDPQVTVSMSPSLTAFTGMDAFTHCIEAYVSSVDFKPGDAMAIGGIELIAKSLVKAVNDGNDIEARQDMLVASMMGGVALSLNGLGACHAMTHQLSAYFNMPHGLANAVLLTRVMEFNLGTVPKKFAKIAEAMGGDIRGLSDSQAAEKALEMVRDLTAKVGIPKYLDDIGATKKEIPEMVERAMRDHPLTTNPKKATPEDIANIFFNSFK
jgi:alcohol dehydrogenase class IV